MDQSQLLRWLHNLLRRKFYEWPPYKEALKKAKRKRYSFELGREVTLYECVMCGSEELYSKPQVEVDHVVSVAPYSSADELVAKLFCSVSGLQVLCKAHHRAKTKVANR